MKKFLIIIAFLISINSTSQGNKGELKSLKMNIEISNCIDVLSSNEVTLIIENLTERDIWIKPQYLNFYFQLYSSGGNIVPKKTTEHLESIELGYLKIGKKSKKEILWKTNSFGNFRFELNEQYFIQSGYDPLYLTKSDKEKIKRTNMSLVKNKFFGKSNLFEICKSE